MGSKYTKPYRSSTGEVKILMRSGTKYKLLRKEANEKYLYATIESSESVLGESTFHRWETEMN